MQQKRRSRFTNEPTKRNVVANSGNDSMNMGVDGITNIPPNMQKYFKYALSLYVSNIPENITKQELITELNNALYKIGGVIQPGQPITTATPVPDKRGMYLLFRSIEQTNACFQLQGLVWKGRNLRFKRPKQYQQNKKVRGTRPYRLELDKVTLRKISSSVQSGSNRLYIGHLPLDLDEQSIIQFLSKCGMLKSFQLTTDKITGASKGFGYCEYINDEGTLNCLCKLNGTFLNNKNVIIKRVSGGDWNQSQAHQLRKKTLTPYQQCEQFFLTFPLNQFFEKMQLSSVLILKKILIDVSTIDLDWALRDLKKQLQRIGKVKLKVQQDGQSVLCQLQSVGHAKIGMLVLRGRKYNQRVIQVQFYPANKFLDKQ